jgi:photosystem II stability/assembly factor-like uncharacterized protein
VARLGVAGINTAFVETTMKRIAIACALFGALLLEPCLAQTNWQKVNSGSTSGFKGVHLLDTKRGYVVGSGPMLKTTTDGGATWSAPIEVTGATQDLWGVFATHGPAADTICVVGENGAVHRSVNGGAAWTTQDMHYSQGFAFAVTGTDARNMYVTGYEGAESGQQGLVIATHDGGETWVKGAVQGAGTFDKSFFLTAELGYAAGGKPGGISSGGVIMKTTDGGFNWTTAATTPYSMNSIYCFDENRWVAVGFEGLAIGTTDGGKNWKRMTMPAAQAKDPFTHVLFVDDRLGFIASAYGAMLKTTDGGATWTRDNSFIAGTTIIWSMTKAESETETILLACGEAGSIFRYRIKKQQQQPAVSLSANAIDFGTVLSGSKELGLVIAPANQLGLRIDSAYIESPASGFTLVTPTGPWPVNLQLGNSMEVMVRFTHAGDLPDDVEGMLKLTTNDPAHPVVEIPLYAKLKEESGSGAAELSATSIAFGKVDRNGTKDLTLTLSATKPAGVRVQAFSIENEAIPGTFVVTSPAGPFPITVPMGAPLTITVRFKPVEVAQALADLYITTDAGSGEDMHVALTGEGVLPVASAAGSSRESGLALAAYPNPVSGSGAVHVRMPAAGALRVALYDLLGRECMVLFDGICEEGPRGFPIDASELAEGRYTCVARTGAGMAIEPVTIVR